jgi:hypothetical protein
MTLNTERNLLGRTSGEVTEQEGKVKLDLAKSRN